jgi:hypothetical protein
MNSKSKPRWYQFSLRTMLIVMVLSSAAFGWWVHWSMEWIRQRHEVMKGDAVWHAHRVAGDADEPCRTPAGLWLFGEPGYSQILLEPQCDSPAKISKLFPEAKVYESREWNAYHRDY